MIDIKDIKQGNIINLDGRNYRVEINTSTGDVRLIYLPVVENIEIKVEVLK